MMSWCSCYSGKGVKDELKKETESSTEVKDEVRKKTESTEVKDELREEAGQSSTSRDENQENANQGLHEVEDEVRQKTEQLSTSRDQYQENANQEQTLASSPSSENTIKETAKRSKDIQSFKFSDLAAVTGNFSSGGLLGEGGFGKVYKGTISNTGQIVAVKKLDKNNGQQGRREFLAEVSMLSRLNHPNLVDLIGFCNDPDQPLLVYEYMQMGSLDNHLIASHSNQALLSWHQRMKIALDAARGLEFLHKKVNPPIIYRDLKCSNILLDDQYKAKLSDFGLAKHGPTGDDTSVRSTRVMGTEGYCAPEYLSTGRFNAKTDVYSYGVVLLELITGRQAIESTRPSDEQELVKWAEPILEDKQRYKELVDPRLGGQYPEKSLNQAVRLARMCLQPMSKLRPMMTDVVAALIHLATPPDEETGTSEQENPLLTEKHAAEEESTQKHDVKGKGFDSFG